MFTPTGQACTSITLAQAQKPQTATPAPACGQSGRADNSGRKPHEHTQSHSHTQHTLAQLTSQFSAHNARKCRDPSENGDEEEAELELEDEPEHEEEAAKRRLQLCLEMQTKLCLWKVT